MRSLRDMFSVWLGCDTPLSCEVASQAGSATAGRLSGGRSPEDSIASALCESRTRVRLLVAATASSKSSSSSSPGSISSSLLCSRPAAPHAASPAWSGKCAGGAPVQ